MALKAFDGFEKYAAQPDMQARTGVLMWNTIQGFGGFTTGRGGYGSAYIVGNQPGAVLGASFNANYTGMLPTFAVQLLPTPLAYYTWKVMDSVAGIVQMSVRFFVASGVVIAYSGDPDSANYAQLAASPPNSFSPYIWNQITLNVVPSTSGSFNVQVNGNSVLSASGVQTVGYVTSPATTNNWANGIQLVFPGNVSAAYSELAYVDDFNLCDNTTGPGTYPCNGFIGDFRVARVLTTGNVSVQWTPLANSNWQEVGGTTFQGDNSYNSTATVGNSDKFTFGAIPSTTTVILGAQLVGAYRKQDASGQTIKQSMISGGTTAAGAVNVMSLSYAYYTDLFVLDPNTSANWTATAINALEGEYTLNS